MGPTYTYAIPYAKRKNCEFCASIGTITGPLHVVEEVHTHRYRVECGIEKIPSFKEKNYIYLGGSAHDLMGTLRAFHTKAPTSPPHRHCRHQKVPHTHTCVKLCHIQVTKNTFHSTVTPNSQHIWCLCWHKISIFCMCVYVYHVALAAHTVPA